MKWLIYAVSVVIGMQVAARVAMARESNAVIRESTDAYVGAIKYMTTGNEDRAVKYARRLTKLEDIDARPDLREVAGKQPLSKRTERAMRIDALEREVLR